MKATAIEIPRNGSESKYFKVMADEILIGFLEKYPNTRTEKHPWKAYKANYHGQFGEYVGAFYGKEGKQDAIESLEA